MGGNLKKQSKRAISEINVVPLVDIMLVLLVIFIITTPLMFNGINLKLPRTKKVHHLRLVQDQIVISVSKAGDYFLGQDKILENELLPVVVQRMKELKQEIVFIRADYGLKYGRVAKLISGLKRGGVANISLVTEIEK